MKPVITFLGTSQAVPTEARNHTAILLKYKDETILFDCGEGTQRQFRKAKINPGKITRLCITHWHGDHVLGIPGLLQTLALNNYSKTLNIYGPKGTQHYMKKITTVFAMEGKIKIKIHEVTGTFLKTPDFTLTAHALDHGTPANGYRFEEKDKRRIHKEKLKTSRIKNNPKLALLIQGKDITIEGRLFKAKDFTYTQKGKILGIILDTKVCQNANKLAKNADVVIIESTYMNSEAETAREYKHLTATQAATIAKNAKAKELYLTHISQRYEHKEKKVLEEARKVFKNVKLAEDLMSVEM